MKSAVFTFLSLATLAPLAPLAPLAAAADFDYTNDREFQRKYPDLACIDTGALSQQEAESFTAAKLQTLGRSDKVDVQRARCFGDDHAVTSGTMADTVTGSEFLDRLYSRLGSGPVPNGFFDGKVILSRDRGIKSVSELGIWMPAHTETKIEAVAQRLWAGKFFDRQQMYLKNRINLDGISWNSAPTSINDKRMKFPAKLYCGQSLFDSRRESIIIDYKYGVQDRPQGMDTDKKIDWLAGSAGLEVRDEVRMVKPGLYLGRAYMHGAFGLYFVLEYRQGTGTQPSWADKDDCWLGSQRQLQLGMRPSDYGNNAPN